MLRDSKAVTPVIGFILLLQILIIFLAFVQTTIVPDQLKKIEADNVKSVKNEIEKFSAMSLSGENSYMSIKTPNYPDYLFLLTPEPAGFFIRTEPMKINLTMNLALPNGSKITINQVYDSNRIYVGIENYFYPDTVFIFENTALFQKSDQNIAVISDQQMLKGGLNIVVVKGNLSSSYNSPQEFVFKAVSSGGKVYGENITLEFETVYPEYWKSAGFNVTGNKVKANVSSGYLSVNVISSSSSFHTVPNLMIKTNAFDSYTVSAGDVIELGVQVLDKYFNPLTGVKVNVTVSGGIGSVTPSTLETDTNGKAVVSFRATDPGVGYVTFDSGTLNAKYQITVLSGNVSSGGILQVNWLNSSGIWDVGKDGSRKILKVRVTDAGSNPVPNVNVDFVSSNTSVIELNRSTATTDNNGVAIVESAARANGSAKIYAFAGDAGDVVEFTVTNVTLWLNGWSYRIPIYIKENSGNNLNGYQVLIQLNSSFNWSAVNSDGSDIRFTDTSNNLLNYWIEEWNYGVSAKIWVKLNLLANENKTVYMYYGNASAASMSNGTATFTFFDDFNGAGLNLSVWVPYSADYTVGNSILKLKKGGIELGNPLSINLQNGYIAETKIKFNKKEKKYGGTIPEVASAGYINSLTNDNDAAVIYMREQNSRNVHYWIGDGCGDGYEISSNFAWSSQDKNWYITGISIQQNQVKIWKDYTVTNSANGIGWCQNIKYIRLGGYQRDSNYNIQDTEYDWVRIRKYVYPEPTVTLGKEEKI